MPKVVSKQRIIKVDKSDDVIFNMKLINDLDPIELVLYGYISAFKTNGFNIIALSSKHFSNQTGITRKTMYKAFNGLVNKGYLVKESNNVYLFCPNKFTLSNKQMASIVLEYLKKKYDSSNSPKSSYYDYSLDYHEGEEELDIWPECDDVIDNTISRIPETDMDEVPF